MNAVSYLLTVTHNYAVSAFDDLPEHIQDKVLERYGDWETQDSYWTEYIHDDFIDRLAQAGLTTSPSQVRWRGFWSQGDGLSFEADVDLETFARHIWGGTTDRVARDNLRLVLYAIDQGCVDSSVRHSDYSYSTSQWSSLSWRNPHDEYIHEWKSTNTGIAPVKTQGSQYKAWARMDFALSCLEYELERYTREQAGEWYRALEREYDALTDRAYLSRVWTDDYGKVFDQQTGEMFDRADVLTV